MPIAVDRPSSGITPHHGACRRRGNAPPSPNPRQDRRDTIQKNPKVDAKPVLGRRRLTTTSMISVESTPASHHIQPFDPAPGIQSGGVGESETQNVATRTVSSLRRYSGARWPKDGPLGSAVCRVDVADGALPPVHAGATKNTISG